MYSSNNTGKEQQSPETSSISAHLWNSTTTSSQQILSEIMNGFPVAQSAMSAIDDPLSNDWPESFNQNDLLSLTAAQLQSIGMKGLDSGTILQLPYEIFDTEWMSSSHFPPTYIAQGSSRKYSEIDEQSLDHTVASTKPSLVSQSSDESNTSRFTSASNDNGSLRRFSQQQHINDARSGESGTPLDGSLETEENRERRRAQNRIAQRLYRKRKEQALQDRDEEINDLKTQLERERKLNRTLSRLLEMFKESMAVQKEKGLLINKQLNEQSDASDDKTQENNIQSKSTRRNSRDDVPVSPSSTAFRQLDLDTEDEGEQKHPSGSKTSDSGNNIIQARSTRQTRRTSSPSSIRSDSQSGSQPSKEVTDQNICPQRPKRPSESMSSDSVSTLLRPLKVMRQAGQDEQDGK